VAPDLAAQGGISTAARYVEDVDRDPVVILDGLTKNWRYPGWRTTWTVGPRKVIEAVTSRLVPRRRRLAAAAARGDPAARSGVHARRRPGRSRPSSARSAAACSTACATSASRRPAARGHVLRVGVGAAPAAVDLGRDEASSRRRSNRKVITVPGDFFDVNPGKRRGGPSVAVPPPPAVLVRPVDGARRDRARTDPGARRGGRKQVMAHAEPADPSAPPPSRFQADRPQDLVAALDVRADVRRGRDACSRRHGLKYADKLLIALFGSWLLMFRRAAVHRRAGQPFRGRAADQARRPPGHELHHQAVLPADVLLPRADLRVERHVVAELVQLVPRAAAAGVRVVSTMDLVFDNFIMERRMLASCMYGLAMFCLLNVLMPLVFKLSHKEGLLFAAAPRPARWRCCRSGSRACCRRRA
jgi:hypothetical protein